MKITEALVVLFLVLFGLVLGGMLGQPYCSSSQ